MRTLGVPEEHVLDGAEGDLPAALGRDGTGSRRTAGVTLYYNHTDPNDIRDGVDAVTVVRRDSDSYLVTYSGYHRGYLVVSPAGARALGERCLTGREELPRWLLDTDTVDPGEPPDWVPDGIEIGPTVTCEHCGTATDAGEIVTPAGRPGPPRYCRDCWHTEDVRFPF